LCAAAELVVDVRICYKEPISVVGIHCGCRGCALPERWGAEQGMERNVVVENVMMAGSLLDGYFLWKQC
jgi:hypothetical protein